MKKWSVQPRLREHHGLAAERAHLCAADVERVAQACDVGQRDVGAHGGQAVAQTRPVHEQPHVEVAAHLRQRLQLGQRVHGAVLGGVRDVHGARCHDVLAVLVAPVRLAQRAHVGGHQLAVDVRQRQRLAPARLHGAGFVRGDVAGGRRHDALPGPQDLVGHGGVGLRASHQKVHVRVRARARFADALAGGGAHLVGAVAGGLVEVGGGQAFEDRGMGTLHIVAVEVEHRGVGSFLMRGYGSRRAVLRIVRGQRRLGSTRRLGMTMARGSSANSSETVSVSSQEMAP